ncbi:hypothetical protein CI109_106749 [Kwoniella shandongensis]|uniref:Uncharacterized protein n=1 Tax=Kwoniella shandongensis TaxID=1734106 RepID=A0A5M6C6R4_9TREE|nr:uncharacterized protein CI109_000994 [Kwoniella shandongensis]KAA5530814.1 hypothetical protein CI109_000994 [Kwoniella shandongensis]
MSRPPPPPPPPSNPLQRAHALSAHASTLLRPLNPSSAALNDALVAYREAAELYDAQARAEAQGGQGDEGTKATLNLLIVQHRKLARDLERRIANTGSGSGSGNGSGITLRQGSGSAGATVTTLGGRSLGLDKMLSATPSTTAGRSANDGSSGVGLAAGAMGASPWHQNPGIASRLSPPRGIPPFSLRPPPPLTTQSQPVIPTINKPDPLSSSSSSSETTTMATTIGPEDSYIHFGAAPDTLDPFSRFWGMLENMLEDISNPVVFASAPLDVSPPPSLPNNAEGKKGKVKKDKGKSRKRDIGKKEMSERDLSPTESFYVVRKGKETLVSGEESENDFDDVTSNAGPSPKTLEELILENTSLKTSLDSLASYVQTLEQNNRQLKSQLEEREKKVLNTIDGVRREVGKVKRDQEVWRSQILAGSMVAPPPGPGAGAGAGLTMGSVLGRGGSGSMMSVTPGSSKDGQQVGGDSTALKKRIKELEDEVKGLKLDNEKHKTHIERYRDRFEKIKFNARAKKQAKLAAEGEGGGGSSHLQSNGPNSADADG